MWCKNCARTIGTEGKVTFHTEVADWFFNNYKSWGVARVGDPVSISCTPKENRFLLASSTHNEPEDASDLYYNFYYAVDRMISEVKDFTNKVGLENSALVKLRLYRKSEGLEKVNMKVEFHRGLNQCGFYVWVDNNLVFQKVDVPKYFPTYDAVMIELEKLNFNELVKSIEV